MDIKIESLRAKFQGEIGYKITPHVKGKIHGIQKIRFYSPEKTELKYFLYDVEVTKEEYDRHELIEKLAGLK